MCAIQHMTSAHSSAYACATQYLVQGFGFVVGKLWFLGLSLLWIDQEESSSNWKGRATSYLYLAAFFMAIECAGAFAISYGIGVGATANAIHKQEGAATPSPGAAPGDGSVL